MPDSAARVLADAGGVLMIMNSLGRGGGDRVGVLLANGFVESGIPTRIALLRGTGEPEVRSRLDRRVSVVSAGPPMGLRLRASRPPLGHQHLERFRGTRFIRRQIDSFAPAVVLGASDNMGLVTALARRPADARVLFALKLTNRLSRPGAGALRRLSRHRLFGFIFDRLDLVLTLTDAERSNVLSLHPGREDLLRTVPNPYVTDAMLADPPPRAPGAPRLLAAGRLVAQKRFDNLLRAFAAIGHADARLTILGEGPLRPSLESLASSLGIADRVDMPGHGDVIARLRQSDLFVLSSDYEGLPAVLIEALACNVPVATTDSFFAAHALLDDANSCAVAPIGDPGALAQAIDRCLTAPRARADLRSLAMPYRIEPAIDAHISALAQAVEALRRS